MLFISFVFRNLIWVFIVATLNSNPFSSKTKSNKPKANICDSSNGFFLNNNQFPYLYVINKLKKKIATMTTIILFRFIRLVLASSNISNKLVAFLYCFSLFLLNQEIFRHRTHAFFLHFITDFLFYKRSLSFQ